MSNLLTRVFLWARKPFLQPPSLPILGQPALIRRGVVRIVNSDGSPVPVHKIVENGVIYYQMDLSDP